MTANMESDRPVSHALTAREIAVLDFEREWTRHVGAKEEAIREVFGLSAARYYQVLNTVIDSPHAVRHNPMLVKRLQRARDARVQTRATRTLSSSRQVDSAHRPLPDETTD